MNNILEKTIPGNTFPTTIAAAKQYNEVVYRYFEMGENTATHELVIMMLTSYSYDGSELQTKAILFLMDLLKEKFAEPEVNTPVTWNSIPQSFADVPFPEDAKFYYKVLSSDGIITFHQNQPKYSYGWECWTSSGSWEYYDGDYVASDFEKENFLQMFQTRDAHYADLNINAYIKGIQ